MRLARGRPPELDRDQNERRTQRLAPCGVFPIEEARSDVEDAERLILKLCVRLAAEVLENAVDTPRMGLVLRDDLVRLRLSSARVRSGDDGLIQEGSGICLVSL